MADEKMKQLIESTIRAIMEERKSSVLEVKEIPLEVSARHVHLSQQDLDVLFGKGYNLNIKKQLSQPGEFLAQERIKIATSKGELASVAILGPVRAQTQVELSATYRHTCCTHSKRR